MLLNEIGIFTEKCDMAFGGMKREITPRQRRNLARVMAPPTPPTYLADSDHGGYDEKEKLAFLLSQGYKIEVVDPYAEAFNEKYCVFNELPMVGKQIVEVNEFGDITG